MATAEAPFSDLINKPRATLELLAGSNAHSIRLRRRDDVDLVVTTAPRYEQEHTVVRAAVRLFSALMRQGDRAPMLDVLPDVFPWVEFLPSDDRSQFLAELVGLLRAAEDLDNLTPVAQLIIEWQHTAEVHADPALLTALRQEADDLGPAPAPDAPA
jgi:hypothetical protein